MTNGQGDLGIFGTTEHVDEMGGAAPEQDAAIPDNFDNSGNLPPHEDLLRRRTALQNQIATLEQVMEPMNRNACGRAQMPPHWPLELKRMKQEVAFIDMVDDLDALRRANRVTDETLSNLSPEDYAELRDYLPPPSPVGARPSRARVLRRHGRPPAPSNVIPHDDYGAAYTPPFDHEQAVADVAADLHASGGHVGIAGDPFARTLRPGFGGHRQRPRRDGLLRHLLRRATFYAVTLGEIALDELRQIQMNLDVTVDDLDPGPDPMRWQHSPNGYPAPSWHSQHLADYPELDPWGNEIPEHDGEQSFANRLYCGVFGQGGIGR